MFVLTARPDDTGMVPIHPHIVSDLLDLLNEARSGTFVAEPMCVCRTDAFGCGSWDCIIKPAAQEPQEGYRERPITEDFYEHNGEWVYRWNDGRWVLRAAAQEPPADGGDRG